MGSKWGALRLRGMRGAKVVHGVWSVFDIKATGQAGLRRIKGACDTGCAGACIIYSYIFPQESSANYCGKKIKIPVKFGGKFVVPWWNHGHFPSTIYYEQFNWLKCRLAISQLSEISQLSPSSQSDVFQQIGRICGQILSCP